MVSLNCAAVPDSLLESELFGHVRGSFTGAYRDKSGLFELAHSGTIFLDEIGETSPRMQALMLRFLENGEVWRIGAQRVQGTSDVRVIAATNRNLAQRMAEREFRADLYYRLNVLHIEIAPLRDRREDIPLFLDHFLQVYTDSHRTTRPVLSPRALAALVAYDWPGNVRELKNQVERLVIRHQSGVIDEADLPDEVLRGSRSFRTSPAPEHVSRVDETATSPAARQEPRARRRNGRGIEERGRMESSIPSGEEEPGRGWVGRRDARQRGQQQLLYDAQARVQGGG